jgi:phytanoyl-CoA hydroxylase
MSKGNLSENIKMSNREFFESEGYYIARGLFTEEEVARYRTHYDELRKKELYGDNFIAEVVANDPLKEYPRQMHMHRSDPLSMDYLCDARINDQIMELTGTEPLAVQTMFYFKPAGARGQALHQDNFYLKASPSTCIAAWLAVDDCDEENGCIMVVPGSQKLPTMCLGKSDTTKSFTDVEVPVPDGMEVRPALMKAGDVLFFNGQVIHGSNPNTSKDRFRRSLISHYVLGDCDAVAKYYFPVYRMDKSKVELRVNEGGGKCGEWVEIDGSYGIEMVEKGEKDLISITE